MFDDKKLLFYCVCVVNIVNVCCLKESQTYWTDIGRNELKRALNQNNIYGTAKNIILFIGDGMGPTTVTTSRIYGKGEQGHLAFEKFQNIGLLKTYSANKLIPDSCSTGTALFTGIKVNHKTAGVDATVDVDDCIAAENPGVQLKSILSWAKESGKSTGFVTTTRVTHATPSALYAHTPNRNWECGDFVPKSCKNFKDIARQLIENEPGRNINVIMGGGRQCLQSNVPDSEADPVDTWSCYSKDGRDLIRDWVEQKKGEGVRYSFVENNGNLNGLDVTSDYVLGIFANGHLKMDYARDRSDKGMPSLMNMTTKAIEVLQKNAKGYFLMVEGGLIDFGHHRGHAKQALDETIAFSNAIEAALQMTDEKETLIVVTADHSHSLTFTGSLDRENNIIESLQTSDQTGRYFTPLIYGTGGPNNYKYTAENGEIVWTDPSNEDRRNFLYSQQSAILDSEVKHGGTDVAVYANGPMAHLFNSVHEETYVAYVISYAAEIGPFGNRQDFNTDTANSTRISNAIFILIFITILLQY